MMLLVQFQSFQIGAGGEGTIHWLRLLIKGKKMKWWAYIHSGSGAIVVRRYFVNGDLKTADRSPYIRRRTEPFHAENKETAEAIAKEMLRENSVIDAKGLTE